MQVDIRKSCVELVCNWCHKPIMQSEFRLMWVRKNGAFTNKYYYHCEPDCWMEERLWYAEQRHEPVKPMGRPRLSLSKEDRKERVKKQKRDWWKKNRGGKREEVHDHSGD